MKKTLLALATAAACAAPLAAFAQAAAPAPEFTFTGNAGVFSDYRFRGFTQTDYNPAFQGGFDFAHKSGFYLGNWNSNVSSEAYNGASLEMDFYGGYKFEVIDGVTLDLGAIYYFYPGTGKYTDYKAKNLEAYIGGSYGPVSLKYYYAFTNFFGLEAPGIDTKGSQYLDLSAAFDLGSGFGINGHVGYQKVKNFKLFGAPKDSALDYKLGVTYDIAGSGFVAGLAVVGGSKKDFFTDTEGDAGGKLRPVVSLTKSF